MKFYPVQYLTADVEGFTHQQQAETACASGFRWIQFRSKIMSKDEMLQTARDIRSITDKYKAMFIVNDLSEIAFQVKADGVHLGKEDESLITCRQHYPDLMIGYSCNTVADIAFAQHHGADYCGIGPYRYTSTRAKLNPILGYDGLKQIMNEVKANRLSIPVFAIGGVTAQDIPMLQSLGVSGVALSSYITNALLHSDEQRISELINLITNIQANELHV